MGRSEKQRIRIETVKDAGKPSYDEMYLKISDIVRDYFKQFFGSDDDIPPAKIARDVPLNSWAGCMCHIFKVYVSHIETMDKTAIPWHNGGISGKPSYDMDMIDKLLNIYISLCKAYDKPQSASAFADMTGIDNNTITAWGHAVGDGEVTLKRNQIYKKISGARKESITNRVLDGGARTLGAVTMYNNEVLGGTIGTAENDVKQLSNIPRFQLPG